MISYSISLAFRSIVRSPWLSTLSMLVLALGLTAVTTTLSVSRSLAGNPVPGRADTLYNVQADSTAPGEPESHGKPPDTWTWHDVQEMQRVTSGTRQTAVVNTDTASIQVVGSHRQVESAEGLEVQRDFFSMFDVPLVAGSAWDKTDEEGAASRIVISSRLASKLFGAAGSAIGQSLRLSGHDYRVVGVSGEWHPYPHFYGLQRCIYACPEEDIFIPIPAARQNGVKLATISTCGGAVEPSDTRPDAEHCRYLGYWAELPPARKAGYQSALEGFANVQKELGRYAAGASGTRITALHQFIVDQNVVPATARLGVWLALSFLVVCVADVSGIMLTKSLKAGAEYRLRRALGASRAAILQHGMTEAALVGCGAMLLAAPMVFAAVALMRRQAVAYAQVIRMEWTSIVLLVVASLVMSMLLGCVPAFKAFSIHPGGNLRGK